MIVRRRVLALALSGFGGSFLAAQVPTAPPLQGNATLVYVGSRTSEQGKGIYFFRLQSPGLEVTQNTTLVPLGVAAETQNPTFFEIDTRRRLLFAVNEVEEFESRPGGSVSVFAVGGTGELALISRRASMGARPCQLAIGSEGQHLLVVNCADGTLAVLPVAADGQLGAAADVLKGVGAACVATDPAGRFALVCDPSSDRVLAYKLSQAGNLEQRDPPVSVKKGASPRRIVFRPDARFAYVLNERSSTVVVFAYDATTGALTEVQSVSTVPEYYDGVNRSVDLQMHFTGRYLYVSNSGSNGIVMFNVDNEKGTLSFVEEQSTGGRSPREFGLQTEPVVDGKPRYTQHLAISLPGSNQVLAGRVDEDHGRLNPSGIFADVPSPAAIRFLPPIPK
jgi:6-phosphogluconolactonase